MHKTQHKKLQKRVQKSTAANKTKLNDIEQHQKQRNCSEKVISRAEKQTRKATTNKIAKITIAQTTKQAKTAHLSLWSKTNRLQNANKDFKIQQRKNQTLKNKKSDEKFGPPSRNWNEK